MSPVPLPELHWIQAYRLVRHYLKLQATNISILENEKKTNQLIEIKLN